MLSISEYDRYNIPLNRSARCVLGDDWYGTFGLSADSVMLVVTDGAVLVR